MKETAPPLATARSSGPHCLFGALQICFPEVGLVFRLGWSALGEALSGCIGFSSKVSLLPRLRYTRMASLSRDKCLGPPCVVCNT